MCAGACLLVAGAPCVSHIPPSVRGARRLSGGMHAKPTGCGVCLATNASPVGGQRSALCSCSLLGNRNVGALGLAALGAHSLEAAHCRDHICSRWQLGLLHVAAASDPISLVAAAPGGIQRCSGGERMPCGARCLPGAVKHGCSGSQHSGSNSWGWAHLRQAAAVAGRVKAWSSCWIGFGQRQLRHAAAPPPADACPRCSSSVSAATWGCPSVGAPRRQTAP